MKRSVMMLLSLNNDEKNTAIKNDDASAVIWAQICVYLYSVMMKNCNAEFLLMRISRMFFVTVMLCYTVFMIYYRAFRSATI